MDVTVLPSYFKDLRKVPKYIIRSSDKVIHELRAAESLEKSGLDYQKCKAGKGKNYYRIRIEDWRIGIELIHPAVIMITILTRGQVYTKFPPK